MPSREHQPGGVSGERTSAPRPAELVGDSGRSGWFSLPGDPQDTRDVAFGPGKRFEVPASAATVEVFAESAHVRVTTPDARIELYRVRPPVHSAGTTVFDAGADSRLTISEHGRLTLDVGGVAWSLTSEPSPPAEGQPEAAESKPERQPRLRVVGRVGAPPSFRTTRNGKLVGRFPVAEHDGDATKWHTVFVFNERAQRLQDALRKGDQVEVVGYVHRQEKTGRDGQPRVVEQVYAAAVKVR